LPGSSFKWEAVFVALLAVILAILTARLRRPSAGLVTASVIGILWGCAFLFSPVMALIWLAWIPLLWLIVRPGIRLRVACLVLGLPVAVTLPWLVRDYKVFHAFIFIRDNLGTELAAANNDCAGAWSPDNVRSGCHASVHPGGNPQLDLRITQIGEYRFNIEQLHKAREWIAGHPGRFWRLCVQRFLTFWLPVLATNHGIAFVAVAEISFINILTPFGLFRLWKRSGFAGYLLASCVLVYPAIYYLCQIDLRYCYPILWVSLLAVGHLASVYVKRLNPVGNRPGTEMGSTRIEV